MTSKYTTPETLTPGNIVSQYEHGNETSHVNCSKAW